MTEPPEERHRLAAALRGMRTDSALSTPQLAARLGWSQSKVSKTELGRSRPQPDDVDAWARAICTFIASHPAEATRGGRRSERHLRSPRCPVPR